MINKVLKALTNRASGFLYPALNAAADFTPASEDRFETAVRDLLLLRDRSDDYHVVNALQTVAAFPAVAAEFGADITSYQLTTLVPPTTVLSGGIMIPDEHGPSMFQPVALEFPPARRFELLAINGLQGQLTYGSKTWIIQVRSAVADIFPRWPVELGLRGGVRLGSTWDTGAVFQAQLTPVRYPFALVSEQLVASNDARVLLSRYSLERTFYFADSAEEQLALVLLALGRSNHAVFP